MDKEDVVEIIKRIPSDIIIKFRIVYEDSESERHYVDFDNEY